MNNQEQEIKEEVHEEVQPEQEEIIEEEITAHEEVPVVEEKKNDPKQSWKELREKAERADKLQKERDEYLKLLQQIEEEARHYAENQKKAPVKEEEEFDYSSIDDDEILTGKELKRAWSREQKRLQHLEETIKNQQKQQSEAAIENELKTKYNDFYDVLNPSNIEKLREMRPGLARSLSLNPDLKEKAVETYQAIKDLGIYRVDEYAPDKERAYRNSTKPRSLNSVSPQMGNSPLSQANAFANGLTDELKKQLYKEMVEKAKSR